MTDFEKFGFQSLLRRLGVLEEEKNSEIPNLWSRLWDQIFQSKVRHQRAVFTINTPTLHGLAQSYSDIFYNLHLLSDKIASQPGFEDKKWRSALLSKVSEKNESQRGFKFHWVFWIESLSGICWF